MEEAICFFSPTFQKEMFLFQTFMNLRFHPLRSIDGQYIVLDFMADFHYTPVNYNIAGWKIDLVLMLFSGKDGHFRWRFVNLPEGKLVQKWPLPVINGVIY